MVRDVGELAEVDFADGADDVAPRRSAHLQADVLGPDSEKVDALLLGDAGHSADPRHVHLVQPRVTRRDEATPDCGGGNKANEEIRLASRTRCRHTGRDNTRTYHCRQSQ